MWEMLVFQAQKGKNRSPTPGASGLRVPTLATEVLERAIRNKTLDWPERVMEVYVNHCNDYQTSDTLRRALNTVHKVRQSVLKRRQQEAAARRRRVCRCPHTGAATTRAGAGARAGAKPNARHRGGHGVLRCCCHGQAEAGDVSRGRRRERGQQTS